MQTATFNTHLLSPYYCVPHAVLEVQTGQRRDCDGWIKIPHRSVPVSPLQRKVTRSFVYTILVSYQIFVSKLFSSMDRKGQE